MDIKIGNMRTEIEIMKIKRIYAYFFLMNLLLFGNIKSEALVVKNERGEREGNKTNPQEAAGKGRGTILP